MALNIKDPEADRLAAEVGRLAGESKTRAVRVALEERRDRLIQCAGAGEPGDALRRFLEREAWPQVPAEVLGRPLSREKRERILGYGPEGV